jgi:hypothetical protein
MSRRSDSTASFLCTPRRVAIAGDWHADTNDAVAAIGHATNRNATVLNVLGDFGYRFHRRCA